MKNLILASFLTLIFTQDLITTRKFEVPIDVFYYAADEAWQDNYGSYSSGYYNGNINLADIFEVTSGNITHIIPHCELTGDNEWESFNIEIGQSAETGVVLSGLSYNLYSSGIDFYSSGSFGFVSSDFFNNSLEIKSTRFYLGFDNVNLDNCSSIEFWVEADFGDSGSSGLQGDMNLDGNLDILDVVEIISVILNDV